MLELILLTILILCALGFVIVPPLWGILSILALRKARPLEHEDHTHRASG